jgi:hypothetical protein
MFPFQTYRSQDGRLTSGIGHHEPTEFLYNGKLVDNLIMKHQVGHKWCYLHEQQPDEAFVLMHFNSEDKEDVIMHVGHTAFRMPGTFDLSPRESIEFRAMVVY